MMQTLRTTPVGAESGETEMEIQIDVDVEPDADSEIDREIQAVLDDLTEWVDEIGASGPSARDVRRTDRYRCVRAAPPR